MAAFREGATKRARVGGGQVPPHGCSDGQNPPAEQSVSGASRRSHSDVGKPQAMSWCQAGRCRRVSDVGLPLGIPHLRTAHAAQQTRASLSTASTRSGPARAGALADDGWGRMDKELTNASDTYTGKPQHVGTPQHCATVLAPCIQTTKKWAHNVKVGVPARAAKSGGG